jgi:hypothetical protein
MGEEGIILFTNASYFVIQIVPGLIPTTAMELQQQKANVKVI